MFTHFDSNIADILYVPFLDFRDVYCSEVIRKEFRNDKILLHGI